jgi:hypothetical protein
MCPESSRATEFVFNGATDPCGQGAVVGIGATPDFVQQCGRKPDWHNLG